MAGAGGCEAEIQEGHFGVGSHSGGEDERYGERFSG
jgi:hypothetical protein